MIAILRREEQNSNLSSRLVWAFDVIYSTISLPKDQGKTKEKNQGSSVLEINNYENEVVYKIEYRSFCTCV